MWFAFDMGDEREITSLVLDSDKSTMDYPRERSVEISSDGNTWSPPIAKGTGNSPVTEILLPPTKTRHARISQHGRAHSKHWPIHGIEVYGG